MPTKPKSLPRQYGVPKRIPDKDFLRNFYRNRMNDKRCPMNLRFEAARELALLNQPAPAGAAPATPEDDSLEKTLEQMRRSKDGIPDGQSSSS